MFALLEPGKRAKFARKTTRHYYIHLTLDMMLLHYLWKSKNQIFCRYSADGGKWKQI